MHGSEESGGHGSAPDGTDEQPVGTLRGAGVQVDTARAGRIAVALVLVALVVVGSVLLVAGYRKNEQIDQLRSEGVPVQVTISHCLGLMGGTGSSPAGYECTGTYTYRGTRYAEGVPGSTFYPDRAAVAGVVASGDPGLLSTPSTIASSHTSSTLYIVSALLLGSAAAIGGWLVVRRRRGRPAG
jgi:hypothetical protein